MYTAFTSVLCIKLICYNKISIFLENLDGDFAEAPGFALLLGGGTRVGGGAALGVLARV